MTYNGVNLGSSYESWMKSLQVSSVTEEDDVRYGYVHSESPKYGKEDMYGMAQQNLMFRCAIPYILNAKT